ncbi:MAG: extracellular solute-binding protein, partial [Verrucomicrobiota bacterium]
IIYVSGINLWSITDLNLQYDMNSLIKKYNFDLKKIDPSLIKGIQQYASNGELYGLPADRSVVVTLYNKDLFDRFNVAYPKDGMTWDDAIALAKKMITEGALGRIFHFRARYAQDRLVDPDFPLDWRLQKEVSGSGVHADINSHIIDLGRYLVGEFKEVCGLTNTFITERPVLETPAKGQVLNAGKPRKMGKVTVPDSAVFIGRMGDGTLANLEATRYANGRKNHISIEINGAKGSLCFDFEDMNRLKYFNNDDPKDRQGFRDILVTQRDGIQPYVSNWWPPGHIIGYEHTFVHAIADFVNACIDGKPTHPTFEDGLKNQKVLEAVEQSSKAGKWIKL